MLDFGQNLAGYVEVSLTAKEGEVLSLSHGEVLDYEGNFYNDNYRSAKALLRYRCKEGKQTYKPRLTFYGFRYLRLDEFPEGCSMDDFTAVAIYSEMNRTGFIQSGNRKLNRLYENVLWSQRGNFVDIPTDCPQRDERQGWTGDAQVFAKTACYNYDVRGFFSKWLGDVRAEQRENNSIPDTVPSFGGYTGSSSAWGDVITILPWQLYQIYGEPSFLEENFDAMCRWIDYITKDTLTPYLWTSSEDTKVLWGKHYGDWLALDTPPGTYMGATDVDMIASAFYANSVNLVVQAGKVLGKDVSFYETLYQSIVAAFKKQYHTFTTQTGLVLALHFRLTDQPEKLARQLNAMIAENGYKLKTGFVGTPYLLHALSDYGYAETAYSLLLQEDYPSWLYEVNHGATTVWEHWDGVNDNEEFWSTDMNSFNHYAYGSVMDWVYEKAAGIQVDSSAPGFEKVIIAPIPDKRLGWLDVSFQSGYGTIRSSWSFDGNTPRYNISVPVDATVIIGDKTYHLEKGCYLF